MHAAQPHQRVDYFEIAKKVGPDAIPYLGELTSSSDWEIRHHAVYAIGEILSEFRTASNCLLKFASDSNSEVRHLAALFLARLNRSIEVAVPILLADLRECRASLDPFDYDEECTRIEIVSALGQITPASDALIDEVSVALCDSSLNVRLAAAEFLANYGAIANKLLPLLRSVLEQEYPCPLSSTSDLELRAWTSMIYRLLTAVVEALFKIGNECCDEVLIGIVTDKNATFMDRHRALTTLGMLPLPEHSRQAILDFASNSDDSYAVELARKALQNNRVE